MFVQVPRVSTEAPPPRRYRDRDNYHIGWVFRFKPLHGSYHNYLSDPVSATRRPVSYTVTVFLVPVRDREIDVHTFVQMAIESPGLRWLAPVLRLGAMAVTKYEIKNDADIARYAPESSDGRQWNLTHLDKQLFVNRRLMDRIYLAPQAGNVAPPTPVG